jgi:hypothetical protein
MNRSRLCNTAEPFLVSGLALSLLAIVAFGSTAAARNIIEGFTKSPTFTPPKGCLP